MADDNCRNVTTASSNKGFYNPEQPENYRKVREKGNEAKAREEKLATVSRFFYVVNITPGEITDPCHCYIGVLPRTVLLPWCKIITFF